MLMTDYALNKRENKSGAEKSGVSGFQHSNRKTDNTQFFNLA
jgi:hypothetical protein